MGNDALEDPELMVERQHLISQLGVGAHASQAELGDQAGKGIGEAAEHGPDHAGSAELSAKGPASVLSRFTASRARDAQIELTRGIRRTSVDATAG